MLRHRYVVLLLTLAACGGAEHRAPETKTPPVVVATTEAHEEPLAHLYRTSGTVRGKTTATLTSKSTGYVRSVAVRPGDLIKAGQVLATLEANDVAASVRRAHAGFDQSIESRTEAENALAAAQAAARIAKATRDRVAALHAEKAVSQHEYDEADARARAALATERMAEARLRASSSRIAQAKAELSEVQAALDYARITAPFAGRVLERRVEPGNLASPGTPLLVVEEDRELRIETAVEESRADRVSLGDRATVEIGARREQVTVTVSEIVPMVDVASRAFLVKLDLPADVEGLRSGMFARVSFDVGQRSRLVVPTTAVSSAGAIDRVFAVDGDYARLRMVTLGETHGPWTEVLSGVAPGERVIGVPPPSLTDGARVAVAQ